MTNLRMTLLGTLMIGLLSAVAQPARAALIQLKPQCTASSSVLRLGDLAEIRDVDPAVVQRLKAITLQPAPADGRRIQVRLNDIKARLQALGENLGSLEFRGAAASTVHAPKLARGPQTAQAGLSNQQYNRLERQVVTAISKFLEQQGRGMQVAAISVPNDAETARAILLTNVSSWQVSDGNPLDNETRKYLIRTGGRVGNGMQFEAIAQLAPLPRILVLRRPVDRGHIIQYQDLAWKPVAKLPQNKAILNDPRSVVGMEATRPLSEGRELGERDVHKTLLIKKGDTVEVYSRSGAVRIKTVARAIEEGAYGDLIRLRILDNDATVAAKVIAFHVAEITPSMTQPRNGDGGLRIRYARGPNRVESRRKNIPQTVRVLPRR